MKYFLILFCLFASAKAFTQSRVEIDQLLMAQGLSLSRLETEGHALIHGENTGHGLMIQYSQVRVLFTKDRAVLKKEIEGVSFQGQETLDQLESVRFDGNYILKSDIAGAIYKK